MERQEYIDTITELKAMISSLNLTIDTPLKREIESIFNLRNIDTDCDTIASLLCSFKEIIYKDMVKGNYHQALDTFLEMLESLSYHFVEDEHFCYFDDMYSPDYTCYDILKSIITQIKTWKVLAEDVNHLDKGIAKIAKMEAYEEYGCPFCVMDWRKFMTTI